MTDMKTILVVDGNPSANRDRREIFENWGCHAHGAHDMSDALGQLEKNAYSLVVVQAQAPGMDLTEFIIQADRIMSGQPILAISQTVSVNDAVSAMKAGALDYMVEPVDPQQLLAHVEKTVASDDGKTKTTKPKTSKKVSIITGNRVMEDLLDMVDRVADSSASILIQGESGTGKEMFARYIHEKSDRKAKPFIAVNCAALPENLLESELFGHEKGSFTGAMARKAGKFEQADGGTLLLDEITEMQLHLQSKLLRVIQEKEVDRVGGTSPVSVDVRILATTNRHIQDTVDKGDFREDLYYRLNVIPLTIPPLRERLDDLPRLTDFFIQKFNALDGRNVKCLTNDAMAMLSSMPLKGNVRELENMIQRAVLLARSECISPEDLFMGKPVPSTLSQSTPPMASDELLASPLKDVERKMIFHTLDKTGGNRTHAANILGISVRTLRNKLNEYKETNPSV